MHATEVAESKCLRDGMRNLLLVGQLNPAGAGVNLVVAIGSGTLMLVTADAQCVANELTHADSGPAGAPTTAISEPVAWT